MEANTIDLLKEELNEIRKGEKVSNLVYKKGSSLYMNGQSQMLTQSKHLYEFSVDDEFNDFRVKVSINGKLETKCKCKSDDYCQHKIASLMQMHEELSRYSSEPKATGKEYTREGMIKRVIAERDERAKKAEYKIEFADNIYGEHILKNEKSVDYKITFYNFQKEHGYCSCPDYAADINSKVKKEVSNNDTGIVIAPPLTHLSLIGQIVDNERICIAAQNCAAEPKGAYTGEVSAKMLKSFGVNAVILGHSERRAYYGETSETLVKKVNLVIENELKPIFCCGEQLSDRDAGNHFNIVKAQIEEVLFNLRKDDFSKCVIAYEPVWAIGTGVTASSDQAQEMHAYIRKLIVEKFGNEAAENTTILYGGSCKPSNSKELFAKPDVDGGLIGGASLKADDFIAIINSF